VSKFDVKNKKTAVEIEVPEEAFYIEGLQAAKRGIALDLQKFFTEKNTVEFIESFKKKVTTTEKPTAEKAIPEKPTEAREQQTQVQPAETAETS
jgi:hypothetical protein